MSVRRRLALLVAVAASLAAAAGAQAATGAGATGTGAKRAAYLAAFPGGQQRGVILNNLYGRPEQVAHELERLRLDGVNTVEVYVYLATPDPSSSEVTADPTLTPSDTELTAVADLAKGLGLKVVFLPVLESPGYGWRGDFQPTDVDAWFASWTRQVVHYADLAQSLGNVSMLYVGSENDSMVQYAARWRRLVATVRQHYTGLLSYMATAYRVRDVTWWDALDAVALSPYFSLSSSPSPSYRVMLDAWKRVHLPYLARIYRSFHKPIVFAEIGYRSVVGGFTNPWDQSVQGAPSMTLQANAYAALLDAVATAPYIKGVDWFYWQAAVAPAVDTSFTPQGKYAECVLAQRWAQAPLSTLLGRLDCNPGIA